MTTKFAFTEASEKVFKRKVLSSQFIFVSFFFHKRWDKWVGARVTETDHLYKSFPFNITYCNHSVFTNTCFCLSDILTTWFEKHLLCSSSFSLKQFTKTKALWNSWVPWLCFCIIPISDKKLSPGLKAKDNIWLPIHSKWFKNRSRTVCQKPTTTYSMNTMSVVIGYNMQAVLVNTLEKKGQKLTH